ncbi:MAG TPA: hypothetical protein PKZ84_21265 [Anaerolineae bacterium]|nr:hypothetical protein [Anaerolineae bacterium]HQI87108.1 hypothetical protein [Anaerolineae bacterium]
MGNIIATIFHYPGKRRSGEALRTLVTFIVRLWIDPQAKEPAWEGQVECVRDGTRAHIRSPDDLVRFIEAQVGASLEYPNSQNRRNEP